MECELKLMDHRYSREVAQSQGCEGKRHWKHQLDTGEDRKNSKTKQKKTKTENEKEPED